jgi:hypothetical protein
MTVTTEDAATLGGSRQRAFGKQRVRIVEQPRSPCDPFPTMIIAVSIDDLIDR